jgi:maleylacetate reductase
MRTGTFVFPAIERIVYGQPAAEALRAEVERLGADRVFLMVSGTMNRTTDEIARVRETLGGRYAGVYDRMPPHTPRDAVLEATLAARAARADLVVTFGGGSVTDAGKMVRLCLQNDITDVDGFDTLRPAVKPDGTRTSPRIIGPAVHQVAIPTTLSGGEFTPGAGCSDPRRKVKQGYRHPLLGPRVVIFDPAPTLHTPLWVWLSTGLRGIDHATEGLCSPVSDPQSDAIYVQALRLLSQALPRVKRAPDDLEARLDCQLAIWLSMAGRQGGAEMGLSHAIGHVLGGTCGVAHGHTSCVMLPPVLRYNHSANADRQQLVAAAMGHPDQPAADVIAALVADLGQPQRLAEVGVTREQFSLIASHTMEEHYIHTNPRQLTHSGQIMEILDAAA